MTTLTDLAKRLEEATGADRELDAAVMRACGLKVYPYDEPSGTTWGDAAKVITSSLDAAVALVERVLPNGGNWHLSKRGYDDGVHQGGRAGAYLMSSPVTSFHDIKAFAATPAIALCLAIVRALIEKEKQA
jgi:hypothetical protein